MPYVSVEHAAGVWLDAHVERRWKQDGRWWLSVYYFVGSEQFYRVYDAAHVRPVGSAELQDDQEYYATDVVEPPQAERRLSEPIDLRDAQHIRPLD